MRRLMLALGALAALACAQPGLPPGGPEDKNPPKLLSVRPDTNAVNVHGGALELQFNKVLNERPGNAPSIDRLVLISPSDGAPRVGWHRTRLDIRGRRDWKPNTTYTITVAQGLSDLRGNAIKTPMRFVFSTGPTIAPGHVRGIIFDWTTGRPIANAIVEAIARPDSTVYLALADSTGRFDVEHLPAGTFTVRGYGDVNNNRALDPRELWDSAHVTLRDSARVELLAFVHDTLPAHIASLDVRDSVSLRLAFDKPLAAGQPLDSTHLRLRAADSSTVPIRSVVSAAVEERARSDSIARADSARAPATDTIAARERAQLRQRAIADSIRKALPTPSKPPPAAEFIVTLARPLTPGATYRLDVRGVRTLLGIASTATRTVTVPKITPGKPAAPAPKRPATDSTRPPRR